MKKYICTVCGYIYEPEKGDIDSGIAPGTSFEDIDEDWVCPTCGVGKEDFEPYEDWYVFTKKIILLHFYLK